MLQKSNECKASYVVQGCLSSLGNANELEQRRDHTPTEGGEWYQLSYHLHQLTVGYSLSLFVTVQKLALLDGDCQGDQLASPEIWKEACVDVLETNAS